MRCDQLNGHSRYRTKGVGFNYKFLVGVVGLEGSVVRQADTGAPKNVYESCLSMPISFGSTIYGYGLCMCIFFH